MTTTRKSLLIALLAAAAAAVPALAQAQAPQERGGYVGLQAGTANYKKFCEGINFKCDDSDTAWRFFGGYQYSRNLALELGFANLGAASAGGGAAGDARYEVFAWDLSLLFGPQVTPNLFLFGKAGFSRADVDRRATGGPIVGNASEKTGGITYGFGAQYGVTRNLGLRLEYQQYNNVGKSTTGEDDIGVVTAGIVWKFN